MASRDIIAIAGSAGAVREITAIVAGLPGEFSGSIFIVVHTSADGPGLLAQVLGRAGRLPVVNPRSGDVVRPGHVYVAPPDHHLIVSRGHIELVRGPKENGFRPAADPLFRSVARTYGSRAVGIIVSGGMDDGTLGLQAIKERGGIAIVQDPEEALYSGMPQSALRNVSVDHVMRAGMIPQKLVELARNGQVRGGDAMKNSKHGHFDPAVSADLANPGGALKGPPSSFICPECGGSLWELKNGQMLHYRCHVGHAYTADALVAGQDGAVEEALWTALRTLEETAALRRRLADDARTRKMVHVAVGYEERARQIEQRAGVIRHVLLHDPLPRKLKRYGSPEPAKFLSKQVEQSSKKKARARHR
jgi:two-component system chemotaxis response regulator CheB